MNDKNEFKPNKKQLNLIDTKTKRCGKCKEIKSKSEFSKDRSNKNKLSYKCKECEKKRHKEYREKNPEKIKEYNKEYHQKNKEKHTKEYYQNLSGTKRCSRCREVKPKSEFDEDRGKKYGLRSQCKKCDKEYQKENYKNNPEKVNENNRKWRKNNPEKVKKINKKAGKKRRSIPKNRLSQNISSAIWRSLKNGKQGNHWENLVGYTLKELMTHLESLFKEGMNWENMGKWHIDHIKPISSFNFNSYNDSEFKECWALKNLQPLWESENISKGNKFYKFLKRKV